MTFGFIQRLPALFQRNAILNKSSGSKPRGGRAASAINVLFVAFSYYLFCPYGSFLGIENPSVEGIRKTHTLSSRILLSGVQLSAVNFRFYEKNVSDVMRFNQANLITRLDKLEPRINWWENENDYRKI